MPARSWKRTGALYADNRALLLAELPKAGFTSFAPADGAFYLYCDVGDITGDAAALARTPARGGGRRGDAGHRLRRRSAATSTCASPTRERRPTWPRRRGACRLGPGVAANPFANRPSTRGDGLPPAAAFPCPTAAHQMTRLPKRIRSETMNNLSRALAVTLMAATIPATIVLGAAGDPRRSTAGGREERDAARAVAGDHRASAGRPHRHGQDGAQAVARPGNALGARSKRRSAPASRSGARRVKPGSQARGAPRRQEGQG